VILEFVFRFLRASVPTSLYQQCTNFMLFVIWHRCASLRGTYRVNCPRDIVKKRLLFWTKISVGNKGKRVDTSEQCELQFTLFNEYYSLKSVNCNSHCSEVSTGLPLFPTLIFVQFRTCLTLSGHTSGVYAKLAWNTPIAALRATNVNIINTVLQSQTRHSAIADKVLGSICN